MKQNRNTLKTKIMKHTITIETKKEVEINLPHYFKINSAYYENHIFYTRNVISC